jgi:hypothetical protein
MSAPSLSIVRLDNSPVKPGNAQKTRSKVEKIDTWTVGPAYCRRHL